MKVWRKYEFYVIELVGDNKCNVNRGNYKENFYLVWNFGIIMGLFYFY